MDNFINELKIRKEEIMATTNVSIKEGIVELAPGEINENIDLDGEGFQEMNVGEMIKGEDKGTTGIIENRIPMKQVKISHLNINNFKKEMNEFIDVSKDMKIAHNKMMINLKPVNLGNLEVILIKNNNEINIQIRVGNAEVMSKVEDIADDIKQSLEGKDIKIDISVKEKETEMNNRDEKHESPNKKDEEKRERRNDDENVNQFESLILEMLGEVESD